VDHLNFAHDGLWNNNKPLACLADRRTN